MGLLEGLRNEVNEAMDSAESAVGMGVAEAPAATLTAATSEAATACTAAGEAASAAAARAHAGELTPAQIQLAKEIEGHPYAPIPITNGRFEYEAALDHLSQGSQYAGTRYDECRCACESAVAAMVMRGPEDLKQKLTRLEEIAKSKSGPEWKDLAADCHAILASYEGEPAEGVPQPCIAPSDLSKLSDDLYAAHATKGERDAQLGLDDTEIEAMENDCGLEPGDSKELPPWNYRLNSMGMPDQASLERARMGAANDLYSKDNLKPGETATVDVSQTTPGRTDHAVVIGLKPDGTKFCYDSGVPNPPGPCYFQGQAAVEHLSHMAVDRGQEKVGFRVIKHGQGSAE